MLERYLIEQGAPTLAGLKTGSLFCFPMEGNWQQDVAMWDTFLRKKGILLTVLRCGDKRALLYLCRRRQLQQDLARPGVTAFLSAYGYQDTQPEKALEKLRSRLQECPRFPHEIGLFLGYPLGDVAGFIQHRGKNCKCCGCWKVYCNEREARKRFAQIRKCQKLYAELWNQGRTVWQLTVAA